MDRIMQAVCLIVTGGAAGTAAAFYIYARRLKKEVYEFARKLEEGLDDITAEKEFLPLQEYEDTLWGKISEKLYRVSKLWKVQNEEQIRQKEQIKELISDISHQTKTPIANLKVYVELLKDEKSGDGGKAGVDLDPVQDQKTLPDRKTEHRPDCLKIIETETNKLDFFMQSMVKMSRLETGIIRINKERRNLFETLRAAVAAVVPKAGKKQIQISVNCPDPLYVCHDSKWTREALFNIIDNAVKYTPAEGAVSISAAVQEVYTKISIKDNGRGIALSRQAEIFKRFYREPQVHDQEGIGIGLYLARKIIEMQNGYIEVYSEENCGSDFCVYLQNEYDG